MTNFILFFSLTPLKIKINKLLKLFLTKRKQKQPKYIQLTFKQKKNF